MQQKKKNKRSTLHFRQKRQMQPPPPPKKGECPLEKMLFCDESLDDPAPQPRHQPRVFVSEVLRDDVNDKEIVTIFESFRYRRAFSKHNTAAAAAAAAANKADKSDNSDA